MLNRVKMWWQRKHNKMRSSKEGDKLTFHEQEIIRDTARCPDCGGEFKEGPHGGLAINCICLTCHSEFNLTIIADAVIGERISDAGPRDMGERARVYGL